MKENQSLKMSGKHANILSQVLASVPGPRNNTGDSFVFTDMSRTMASSLMLALIEKEGRKELTISPKIVREYMALDKFIAVVIDESLSENSRVQMRQYLGRIGWESGLRPSRETYRMHSLTAYYFLGR